MPSTPDIPRGLSFVHVLTRFVLRMAILSVFATLGSQDFGKTLEALLVMAALYCAIAATIRREAPLGPVLTHLDEAAAYALLARLVAWIS
jgi:hypothetical protein